MINKVVLPWQHIQVLDHLYEGIYFVDKDMNVIFWNKGAEAFTGYTTSEIVGLHYCSEILMHINGAGDSLCNTDCPVAATLRDGVIRQVEVYFRHKQGHRVPINVRVVPLFASHGDIIGAAQIFTGSDSKESLIHELGELRDAAMVDNLTRQRNRRYGERVIPSKLSEMHNAGTTFGLLFVDIDFFKNVNDRYGHDIGDQVLRMVANTIAGSIRAWDSLIRWGGEEFVVVLAEVSDLMTLGKIADKLRVLVSQSSLSYGKEEIRVTISIGATVATKDDSVESIIQRSDRVMYVSKMNGRNRVTVG